MKSSKSYLFLIIWLFDILYNLKKKKTEEATKTQKNMK